MPSDSDGCSPPRRRAKALDPAQRWTLAVSAQNARLNGERTDALFQDHTRDCMRGRLESWWGARDAEGCRGVCERLLAGMHERGYRRTRERVAGLDEAGLRELLETIPEPAERARAKRVWKERRKVDTALAWDWVRVVDLARMGFTAGYFSEDYAWWWAFRAARALQERFDSYEALARSYWAGFRYWWWNAQDSDDPSRVERERAALAWLREDAHSPWRELPWNTPLPPEEPEPQNRPRATGRRGRPGKRRVPAAKSTSGYGVLSFVAIVLVLGGLRVARKVFKAGARHGDELSEVGQRALREEPDALARTLDRGVDGGESASELIDAAGLARDLSEDEAGADAAAPVREPGEAEIASTWLRDPDPGIRLAAVEILGATESFANATFLIEALADEDAGVRRGAATALGGFGTLADVVRPALELCGSDTDPGVRRAAEASLGRLGG